MVDHVQRPVLPNSQVTTVVIRIIPHHMQLNSEVTTAVTRMMKVK